MKRLLGLILIIQALSTTATDFFDPSIIIIEEKPLCSDVEVRLSIFPIDCIPEIEPIDIDFDIPEVQLDFDELQDIFNGAESSGGHIVGPMNQPQRRRPLTPFPFTLKCEARLLLDGKKKVSFLSTQEFELTANQYQLFLRPNQWQHNLILGSDIYTTKLISIDASPSVEITPFKIELSYNNFYDSFQLAACESKVGFDSKNVTCAQSNHPVRSQELSVSFQKRFQGDGKIVHQTLKLTCKQ